MTKLLVSRVSFYLLVIYCHWFPYVCYSVLAPLLRMGSLPRAADTFLSIAGYQLGIFACCLVKNGPSLILVEEGQLRVRVAGHHHQDVEPVLGSSSFVTKLISRESFELNRIPKHLVKFRQLIRWFYSYCMRQASRNI